MCVFVVEWECCYFIFYNNVNLVILLEDIKDEMKLNVNIIKVFFEVKLNFLDDEYEV